ncbi:unnamed protein product [Bursaphelenchus xylophilus]|uniref:(pine wood nematode) hypothetical protein n=1 Tax=Bursaphelenchus xylophilus TaxID=6326 RepID=A0A1I7RLW4_BURXY|nr:unnamed protein product [Bursaphelenchus xylophilus]CAG9113281.1 unnamed protein product [Bursaphelenchus xylophilus]
MSLKSPLKRLSDSPSEASLAVAETSRIPEMSQLFDSSDHPPVQPRSPRVFTAEKKLEVVAFAKKSSIRAASKHYGIDRKRIREWRDREDLLRQMDPNQKRAKGAGRPVKSKDFDRTIAELVENAARSGAKINRRFILEKATAILTEKAPENGVDLKLSHGWMDSFLKRHQLIRPKSKSLDEKFARMGEDSMTIQDFLNGLELPACSGKERPESPTLDCLQWLLEACRKIEAGNLEQNEEKMGKMEGNERKCIIHEEKGEKALEIDGELKEKRLKYDGNGFSVKNEE